MGFANLIGEWTGQNSLWLRPDSPAFESPTSATIGAVAGGKVVTVNYTWTHEGEAQDGLILLAVDAAEAIHMAWCDSFHMDDKIMDLAGRVDGEVIAATGSYSIPGSELWGWRVELEQINPESFQLRMYNLLPASMGGIEALAVRADYVRSGLAARTD